MTSIRDGKKSRREKIGDFEQSGQERYEKERKADKKDMRNKEKQTRKI